MSQRKRPGLRKRGRYFHISISHCGQEVRKSLETDDEEKAKQLYDKIRAELWDHKHLGKTPEHQWEEAALLYVERRKEMIEKGEIRTLDTHRLAILNGKLNGTPLSQITRKKVTALLKDASSPRHYTAIIAGVLTVALDEEWIDARPELKWGRVSNSRDRFLTDDEAKQLLRQEVICTMPSCSH